MKKARKFKNSGYSEGGASLKSKQLKQWRPQHYSAKSDIDLNLRVLRNRASDLVLNSPLGAAAVVTQLTGVINSGLKLFPRIKADDLGLSEEAARAWNRRTKQEFELWANSLACDFYGRNNFFELQRIAYRNELNDGDCFCVFRRRLPRGENPYSLKLQLIEAQRVSNPDHSIAIECFGKKKGSRIVNGIEVDRSGILQAIWVSNRIWNEPSINPELSWQRVKFNGEKSGTQNILHLCYDTRIEQFRGEPYLSPVIETIKNVSRYADAELTSAIIKAFFALFFEQAEGNFDLNQMGFERNEPCLDVDEYKVENGSILGLPRGVTVKAIDNSNAQSTFEGFTNQFVNQIAAALNLPSELLLKRFQSSYSASKAALLQAQEEFRQRRAAFVQDFCQPIYENFLVEAVALGRIEARGFFEDAVRRRQWSAADWRTETSHLLDPLKEMQASKLKLELGLSTYEQEAAELCGSDYFENARQLQLERELLPDSIAIE